MNKGNFPLFSNWLKQFVSTVFLQSFHAVFLMFTMIMLSQIQGKSGNMKIDGVLAVVAIACAMALIKFEKMIKKLFGIEDSPVGNTAGAGAKMFMGAKSAIDLGKTATGGFKKSRDANKNLKDIQDKRRSKQDSYDRLFNPEEYNKRNPNKKVPTAASARAESIYNSVTSGGTQSGGGAGQTAGQGGGEYGTPSSRGDFNRMLEQERRKEELDELEGQEIKARKAKRAAGIDKYLNAAGTLASVSVGLGAADELSESLTISNLINKPLDVITDKYSNGVAGREIYNESKEKYIKENDALIASGKAPKFVDDDGNRNEVERASKVLEKSITTSIKDGLKDYGSTVVKNSPIKMTVDQVTKFQINHEVKGNKKDLEKIRELQKRQGGNVENI